MSLAVARSTYTLARPVPGTARRIYREQGIDGGSEMCDEVSPQQAGRYNFPWGLDGSPGKAVALAVLRHV
jgi:hypothetical protein